MFVALLIRQTIRTDGRVTNNLAQGTALKLLCVLSLALVLGCSSASTSAPATDEVSVGQGRLVIVTASLPSAQLDTPYSYQFVASGGRAPYSWSIVSGSLPGLSLSNSGLLQGTPTQRGGFQFTVEVQDANPASKIRVEVKSKTEDSNEK
jgi:hypothetical protein